MVFSLMVFSDEPVTGAYIFLGIPLGRGPRRNGECMSLSGCIYRSSCTVQSLSYIVSLLLGLRFQWTMFARHAIVSFMSHLLVWRGNVDVKIARWRGYVKCAILTPMCCIPSEEDSVLAITKRSLKSVFAPTTDYWAVSPASVTLIGNRLVDDALVRFCRWHTFSNDLCNL